MGKVGEETGSITVYLGVFTHALDKEGRIALPARFREAMGPELARGVCLACGPEPCIMVYAQERFGQLVAGLEGDGSLGRSDVRGFKRALGGRAAVVVPDKQGRILIPALLRTHAGITKEVTVLGAVDAIEIWDAATYARREGARQAAFERVAPRVFG